MHITANQVGLKCKIIIVESRFFFSIIEEHNLIDFV